MNIRSVASDLLKVNTYEHRNWNGERDIFAVLFSGCHYNSFTSLYNLNRFTRALQITAQQ